MEFFDDDDDLAPAAATGQSRRYGAPSQRPFFARRLMALVLGALVIILLVLGVKGCLNARKERGFENYARDLAAITTESDQLSKEFFGRLQDPGNLSPLSFKAEISSDRSTAESLLQRVQGLDTPDELDDEQGELELAFELRRDGIEGTADEISTALGKEGSTDAVDRIANYMQYFMGSDVLYGRSKDAVNDELKAQDIVPDQKLSDEPFLPGINPWLDPDELANVLSGVSGAAGGSCPSVCGVALLDPGGVLVNGTELVAGGSTTVSGGGPYELEVSAQNQGEEEATDVAVSYNLSGGSDSSGEGSIPTIQPGDTKSANLTIEPDPDTGTDLTLEVTVGPVPGEEITDNNTGTFTVVFE